MKTTLSKSLILCAFASELIIGCSQKAPTVDTTVKKAVPGTNPAYVPDNQYPKYPTSPSSPSNPVVNPTAAPFPTNPTIPSIAPNKTPAPGGGGGGGGGGSSGGGSSGGGSSGGGSSGGGGKIPSSPTITPKPNPDGSVPVSPNAGVNFAPYPGSDGKVADNPNVPGGTQQVIAGSADTAIFKMTDPDDKTRYMLGKYDPKTKDYAFSDLPNYDPEREAKLQANPNAMGPFLPKPWFENNGRYYEDNSKALVDLAQQNAALGTQISQYEMQKYQLQQAAAASAVGGVAGGASTVPIPTPIPISNAGSASSTAFTDTNNYWEDWNNSMNTNQGYNPNYDPQD